MRKRIFEIIEAAQNNDKASVAYDGIMIILIACSLVPLAFKAETQALIVIDKITVGAFIIDYILRWITADFKLKRGTLSFFVYPFYLMALIDLLSILPSISFVNNSFKVLRILRMIRALRVFRVFKVFRYSKSIQIIGTVIKHSKESLIAVGTLAAGYILISALIIFNV